jgi:hypothetical protein
MEQNGKHYYKVDIPGHYGYSFMVVSNDELDEYDVIYKSLVKHLFECEIDADYAVVDDIISEYDIENFKNCTYSID